MLIFITHLAVLCIKILIQTLQCYMPFFLNQLRLMRIYHIVKRQSISLRSELYFSEMKISSNKANFMFNHSCFIVDDHLILTVSLLYPKYLLMFNDVSTFSLLFIFSNFASNVIVSYSYFYYYHFH